MNPEDTNSASRPLTYGENAVGLNFNPSGDEKVNELKQAYADVIDILNGMRGDGSTTLHGEKARMISVAITEAQTSQMWGVKAATYKD